MHDAVGALVQAQLTKVQLISSEPLRRAQEVSEFSSEKNKIQEGLGSCSHRESKGAIFAYNLSLCLNASQRTDIRYAEGHIQNRRQTNF